VQRRFRRAGSVGAIIALAAVFAVLAAGCGGSKKSSTATSTASAATSSSGKTFANLRVTWDAPDYMDPGLAYTVAAWQIMWNVYEGLVGYAHVNGAQGAKLMPYLAASMPTITNGGKDYKFTLRKGLKYSDGTPVKAGDFAHTVERDYQISSPGVGFFSAIVGADAYGKLKPAAMKTSHISGITTNDAAGTIEIKLSHPEGDMLNILATQFASFVPATTPASDQSTKGIPATGPYMVQSYAPNKNFLVVRNPNFKGQIPGIPTGNPDKVTGKIITDPTQALQQVLSGASDYDFQTIPTDRLAEVKTKYGDQLHLYTPANTYYYFLNSRTPPFDKLQVRQAFNYAIDRNAMLKFFAGLAQTTQNILPPNYPEYQKINYYTYNLAKAKQLVKQSGTTGQKVTVYGVNTDPSKSVTEYAASVLNQLGYKANVKLLAHGVYFTTVGNQATMAQFGFTDWFQDYPSPIDWFDVLFNGNRITQTHNNNYGNADYPAVNKEIEALKANPNAASDAVVGGWKQVDKKLIVDNAAAAPYANRVFTDFFGPKVDASTSGCYVNHVLYQWDFSTICMK
jgi:peptide/nickel transport system substrate-binding protein